ncbi:hypothetical protein BV509_03135 [Rhodovulum sulfidophilum]|uniref:Outer membrane receptor protein involved in Fe transport n=1 Tax=Rhodovulum visakhapatnamense TaxID=364297 RepID=A0A4R8GA52_9RHOB|nr:TonB-dependent receptor [Rhodovulum visakhapatnamense]MBL3569962.1 TonB-dependent receptor [Rhodovulum visakhapatnamense]OLS43421.1 hypothetical protein BV509_03135 [Rhodovulum sulfidophilum]TDX33286.1 outer membrane receptor protein involved in Fe transport [Rhodovulum visakhapatnamense]
MRPTPFAALLGRTSPLALACALAFPAQAQQVPGLEGSYQLDPIILSGEKIDRSIEETASSVSVLTSADIDDKTDAASVQDAISDVPNVFYTASGGAPVIRGQDAQGPSNGATTFFGGTTPRASINVDGHYLSYNELVYGMASIWDVDSIEVFRGPQTSSQGANSIAGAVIVNTKDPTFTPEGAFQLQYGTNNMKRASAVVSGPLSDQVAARLSLDYYGRDTFIDFVNPAYDNGGNDEDIEYKNARFKLLWAPAEIPGLEAKLTFSHTENSAPTWEAATQGEYDDLENNWTSMPTWEQQVNTWIGDISYDFGNGIELSNQLQYSNIDVDRLYNPPANGSASIDQESYTNETRLTFGDAASGTSGVFGLFLARTTSDDVLHQGGTSIFDDEKTQLGIYGEVSHDLTDRWTVTGGLRFQRDHITRSGVPGSVFQMRGLGDLDYDETFEEILPKLSLAYKLTPDVTVGALVNKGYNPGGVNLSMTLFDYVEFEKETVWNYELFARANLLGDRLLLTANLFYSDFDNSQRLLPDDSLGVASSAAIVVNADEAQSYGLELGADFRATDTLRLKGGLGLMQSEIGDFSGPGGTLYTDSDFSYAPGYMVTLGADWDFAPRWTLGGDVRFIDGYYSNDAGDPNYKVDDYAVANARLTYRMRENIELQAFVTNLFDERTPTYLYADRSNAGEIAAAMLEPREFGIGLRVRF